MKVLYLALKVIGKNEYFSRRFRPVEVVAMVYLLDAHRILEKFPMSDIQKVFFFYNVPNL